MPDPAADVRDSIAALLRDGEGLRRQLLLADPASASPARHDLDAAAKDLGTSEAVERVIRLADLWTLIEAEHLRGIGVLLQDGNTVFPMFPLLRAVIEHAAWVCWLLDPEADSRERARRAALAHLRSDQEILGVAKRWAGADTAEYRAAKKQLDDTRASIDRDFDHLDTQVPTVDGEKIATPTKVVEHLGAHLGDARQWRGTYEYLCGTANHPSQNAFEFVEAGESGKTYLALTGDFVNRMMRVAVVAFLHSLTHMTSYLGWPTEPIRAYQERVNTVLDGLADGARRDTPNGAST